MPLTTRLFPRRRFSGRATRSASAATARTNSRSPSLRRARRVIKTCTCSLNRTRRYIVNARAATTRTTCVGARGSRAQAVTQACTQIIRSPGHRAPRRHASDATLRTPLGGLTMFRRPVRRATPRRNLKRRSTPLRRACNAMRRTTSSSITPVRPLALIATRRSSERPLQTLVTKTAVVAMADSRMSRRARKAPVRPVTPRNTDR